jgi:hypothetical protein
VKGCPAGQLPLFQQNNIGAARFGEMIRHTGTEYASTDDDDL